MITNIKRINEFFKKANCEKLVSCNPFLQKLFRGAIIHTVKSNKF